MGRWRARPRHRSRRSWQRRAWPGWRGGDGFVGRVHGGHGDWRRCRIRIRLVRVQVDLGWRRQRGAGLCAGGGMGRGRGWAGGGFGLMLARGGLRNGIALAARCRLAVEHHGDLLSAFGNIDGWIFTRHQPQGQQHQKMQPDRPCPHPHQTAATGGTRGIESRIDLRIKNRVDSRFGFV